MKLTAKQLDSWAQTRKLGRRKFVWTRGVLALGVPLFMGWLVYRLFIENQYNLYDFLGGLAVALPGTILVGYGYGSSRWKANEKQFASSEHSDLLEGVSGGSPVNADQKNPTAIQ